MVAAAAPFQLPFTWCHMITLSLATAAVMVTEGMPRKECFSRGLVKPLSSPSDGLRKWPVTMVWRNLFRCLGVSGTGKALLST